MHPFVGKALYAGLFVVVLPIALILWAVASAPNVHLPAVHSLQLGTALVGGGALLMVWGMASLVVYGGGLPMNAYPPPRFVHRGIYRLVADPIYLGFGMLSVGCSIALGSASGLWLVSPVTILGSVALVLGHERLDLARRFGKNRPRPLFSLPEDEEVPPTPAQRAGVYLLVLVPSFLLLRLLAELGGAVDGRLLDWMEPIEPVSWGLAALAPLVAPSKRVLREFAIRGGIATLLMPALLVTLPPGAFPAYSVVWFLLALPVFGRRVVHARRGWLLLGGAISLVSVTIGRQAILPVAVAVLLAAALIERRALWELLRRSSERVANSWRELHWGTVRVINHGLYAAMGTSVGLLIVGSLLGESAYRAMIFTTVSLVVCGALWAQVVEGSPSLLRPYGFYGSILGGILGCILSWPLFGTDPWLLLAAFAVGSPWTQALGRLRCLAQGCCHGREAPASIGIVYRHPRSRVCRLARLGGVPVHPTPLYSILCNAIIAPVVARLWFESASLSLITGVYFILSGLGRFVEEAYRGEPQTRVMRGLRFYQWIVVVSVVGGAVLTCIRSRPAPAGLHFDPMLVLVSVVMGLATFFAYGVDFPGLNRRFARLV